MAGLTAEQLADFEHNGYLVVEDVLTRFDLAAVEVEYREVLDRAIGDLVAKGALRPPVGSTFSQRYIEALAQLDDMYELYQYLDISLPLLADLAPTTTMHAGRAVFGMLTSDRVLDIVQSVIGPEIYSNPVQHARIKPPLARLSTAPTDANVGATLWHQDAGVVDTEADGTDMLTVWVAVTDASVDNGCLVAVRGSHRGATTLHCPGKVFPAEVYIPEAIIDRDRIAPLEVRAGGVVLLHRLTEHASLDNITKDIRWSFDLRYQPIGQPTGRSAFPGFVARSVARPDAVLSDAARWARLWREARDRIVSGEVELRIGGRWDGYAGHAVCA